MGTQSLKNCQPCRDYKGVKETIGKNGFEIRGQRPPSQRSSLTFVSSRKHSRERGSPAPEKDGNPFERISELATQRKMKGNEVVKERKERFTGGEAEDLGRTHE